MRRGTLTRILTRGPRAGRRFDALFDTDGRWYLAQEAMKGGRRAAVRGDEGAAGERGAGGARREAVGAEGGASAVLARLAGTSRDFEPRRAVSVDA